MFTLRCTARLRIGTTEETPSPPPSTALGNWYAHLLFTRPQLVPERAPGDDYSEAGVIPSLPPENRGPLPSCPASPAGRSVQNAASFSAQGSDPPRDRSRSGQDVNAIDQVERQLHAVAQDLVTA